MHISNLAPLPHKSTGDASMYDAYLSHFRQKFHKETNSSQNIRKETALGNMPSPTNGFQSRSDSWHHVNVKFIISLNHHPKYGHPIARLKCHICALDKRSFNHSMIPLRTFVQRDNRWITYLTSTNKNHHCISAIIQWMEFHLRSHSSTILCAMSSASWALLSISIFSSSV